MSVLYRRSISFVLNISLSFVNVCLEQAVSLSPSNFGWLESKTFRWWSQSLKFDIQLHSPGVVGQWKYFKYIFMGLALSLPGDFPRQISTVTRWFCWEIQILESGYC